MVWSDSIVEEVRKRREAHAAQFNYDLHAIYEALKREEESSDREFVSYAPRQVKTPEKKVA